MLKSSHQTFGTRTPHNRSWQVNSRRLRITRIQAAGEEEGEPASNTNDTGGSEEDDLGMIGQVEQADWRAFRARLVRSGLGTGGLDSVQDEERELWAHPIVQPEPGCLLIAHPNAFTESQQYFHRVVIFIFAHDAGGSAGVILNRPTQYSLGQLDEFKDLMPELSSCPLYFGGDVGPQCTQVIHGIPGLEDSREIMNGVYMGGTASIQDNIRSGQSTPNDYRWFLRFAGWGPGQLEQEVAAGVWYLASCSKRFVLKQCIQLPKPLSNEVMEHMGPPYSDIARKAK
jgi:putative transcriptional regulator